MGTGHVISAHLNRLWMMCVAVGAWTVALPAWLLWPRPIEITRAPQPRFSALREAPAPELEVAASRPPFALDRRPMQPEDPGAAAEPEATVAEQPLPQLVGTIAGRAASIALLQTAAGVTERVRVGEAVDGWRVVAIANRSVALEQNGRREVLRLDFEVPRANAATTPEAATPDEAAPSPTPDMPLSPRAPDRS